MAVLKTYPLDLTGIRASNKITGEVKTIAKDADRVFIPGGGPFYTKSLKIWAGTRLLLPVTDYVALELNREGTIASGKEVCNVIFIKNTATSFKMDYQVIGGEYSDYSNELADLINSTPIDKLKVLTWGSILGKPTTFPPTAHVHYPYEWRGYTQVIHLLEQLRQMIAVGDQSQIASVYQYIEDNIGQIATDYIDRNGLFFIDKNPTPNGNILLRGKGTINDPLGIDLNELLDELDIRYFQNVINPLTRIGSISDSFLPISSGFFNCLVPLNQSVSLSAVGNVERNGDLLMLLPATNGEITRYVYGYVRGWSGDPTISRYRATNQQYRPPGLAPNEEIMDLFGYHEQSMIGSIFTVNADGTAAFKENCVIWLNGTFAAESHIVERLGRELINVLPHKDIAGLYIQTPTMVKLRNGDKYLLYFYNSSGIHVFKLDEKTKKLTQVKNWRGILQKVNIKSDPDPTVNIVESTEERPWTVGQDFCRPFAWREAEKTHPEEFHIIDINIKSDKVTSISYGPGIGHRQRMSVRVVGDVVKVAAAITYQNNIHDPAYRGGSRLHYGFSLEIHPKQATPTYKWVRHKRDNDTLSSGHGNVLLTNDDKGVMDVYESYDWNSMPRDLWYAWHWFADLQSTTRLQLNDGRILIFRMPTSYGLDVFMQNLWYGPSEKLNVDNFFSVYFHQRYWRLPEHGNGGSRVAYKDRINFQSPTANKMDCQAIVLADGTIILYERRSDPRSIHYNNVKMTAYRPRKRVIKYPTATHGVIDGYDTSWDRIELVGDYNGYYDLIPWISVRRGNGTTKVGALWWIKDGSASNLDTAYANIGIDWEAKQFIRSEPYTFTPQGYNAVEDFLATYLNKPGVNIYHYTWSIMASPEDPSTGILFVYAAWENRTASDSVIPVKLQWSSGRLTGFSPVAGDNGYAMHQDSYWFVPAWVGDPRLGWSRLQWVIEYNANKTGAYWAGKKANASGHYGDTLERSGILGFFENKASGVSTWTKLHYEGSRNNTGGYKSLVATDRGVGMMTDDVGFGVFRAFRAFKSLNYNSGTMYADVKPYIYFTPRPPEDFSLNVTDVIDVQLGGVYGRIEPQTYNLTDPTVSDVVDPRNKTIYIYVVLELGKPKINFREVAMAESIYAVYIGKCITDLYGVMELDVQPVSRIGNYRPSATPRGASFSVSSGTADTERLLNWDADIFSSDDGVIRGIPTYRLESPLAPVREGGSVTYVLHTTNVPEGTKVRMTLGIANADVSPNEYTRDFVVGSDGKATLVWIYTEIRESDPTTVDAFLSDYPEVKGWHYLLP